MKKIIIFGTGKIAEVVFQYFSRDPEIHVVALTVDEAYLKPVAWTSLPLVPFEKIEESFSPDDYELFVAVGYQDLNRLRAERCKRAKSKGYTLFSYVDRSIGVPEDFQWGENCLVLGPQNIQPRVKIGHNVFVWSGVTLGHHSYIEDDVWITSGAQIAGNVAIGAGSFIGINATVVDSIRIGKNSLLGAAVLVTQSLPDESVVIERGTEISRLTSTQFLKLSARMERGSA